MKAFDPCAKVPETLIKAFVDKIIYDKDTFSWYLNPKCGNEIFDIDTTDWKKSMLNRNKNNNHAGAWMVNAEQQRGGGIFLG